MNQLSTGRNEVIWPVAQETDWVLRWRMLRRSDRVPLNLTSYEFIGQIRKRANAGSDLIADIEFDKTEGSGWLTAIVRRSEAGVVSAPVGDAHFEMKYKIPESVCGVSGGLLLPLFGGIVRISKKIAVADAPTLAVP